MEHPYDTLDALKCYLIVSNRSDNCIVFYFNAFLPQGHIVARCLNINGFACNFVCVLPSCVVYYMLDIRATASL